MKMSKLLRILALLIVSCRVFAGTPEPICSWGHISFNSYDQEKVNSVVTKIKSGEVQHVTISYDKNLKLADQIITALKSQTDIKIERNRVIKRECSAMQHAQVTLTVYLKGKNGKN